MELKLHHSDTDYEQLNQRIIFKQECTDSGYKVVRATDVFTLPPEICGLSAWNLLRVTLLMPRILRCLLDYWKIRGPLFYASFAKIFNSRDHMGKNIDSFFDRIWRNTSWISLAQLSVEWRTFAKQCYIFLLF